MLQRHCRPSEAELLLTPPKANGTHSSELGLLFSAPSSGCFNCILPPWPALSCEVWLQGLGLFIRQQIGNKARDLAGQ